jgi:hypothetical protein
LENIFEKRDLSVTDWVSVFERERTRRVRNSFADDGWDFPEDVVVNEVTGVAALVWRASAATTFGCSESCVASLFAPPPPGPEVLVFVWEKIPTESVIFDFLSFVLRRDEIAACIRARFDVESVLLFFDDSDRSVSICSIPTPLAALASF